MIDKNVENGTVAIVSFIDPTYGYAGGATRNIQNSCNALASAGFYVDLYAFHNENEKQNNLKFHQGVNIAGQYPISNDFFLFFKKYPFCVERRRAKEIDYINWAKYDLVIFEGEQVYWIYKRIKKRIKKRLIRMHDIESIYRREVAASQNGIMKLLNRLESRKFARIEDELRYDDAYFGFVSTDELTFYKKRYKESQNNLVYLPPFCEFIDNQVSSKTSDYLLFFGDLSLDNNYFSIKWYLENCFKSAREINGNLIIHICGNISEKQKKELESICVGIVVRGFVSDLRMEIEKAKFVVCPILYGAGVKIKLFEALSYGKLVVASPKALEGTLFEGNKHLIVAEGMEEFTNITIKLSLAENVPNYSQNLKKIFYNFYSIEYFVKTIEDIIAQRN